MNNKFKFVMPAELEKADDGSWKVRGLASTQNIDQQGEVIIQKGMDLSPIESKRGILNWDHQKGPENTLGLLDGYKQADNGLYIEGRLFKNHARAKAVREIMESLSSNDKGRMGLSVEGQILERDSANPKIIKKCRINAVALTLNPVNVGTYADLVKSMSNNNIEFDSTEENVKNSENPEEAVFTASQVVQIVEKALGVGAGYTQAPNSLTDGSAMATSDMKAKKDKTKKDKTDSSEEKTKKEKPLILKSLTKEIYKSKMIEMLEKLQTLYPHNSRSEIWESIKERIETKFPDINKTYPEN